MKVWFQELQCCKILNSSILMFDGIHWLVSWITRRKKALREMLHFYQTIGNRFSFHVITIDILALNYIRYLFEYFSCVAAIFFAFSIFIYFRFGAWITSITFGDDKHDKNKRQMRIKVTLCSAYKTQRR